MAFKLPKLIFFTGFMATGKSRLAELTGASLGWKVVDTDRLIEKEMGITITEIFNELGEEKFRDMELELLKKMSQEENTVVALGGGTLKTPGAIELIKKNGILVGLWATPETILARVNRKNTRPLLAGLNDQEKLEKIHLLLAERKDLYAAAHFQIESTENVPHHILTKKIISRIQLESLSPLTVQLKDRSYPIYIHSDLSQHIEAIGGRVKCPDQYLIATDSNLKTEQKDALRKLSINLGRCRVFYFRPGENEKNLTSINRLLTYMLKHQFSRMTTLVAFGGGVVGDMTGFAASIYLRGIPFIQIPTTLLAMVDSSVGGKTGVNHRMGKNLIGSFYQPKAVAISTQSLSTLPEQEFKAGLAEVIKYAVIWDRDFFTYLDEHCDDLLKKEQDVLQATIQRCCQIKADVVSEDEKESGIRAILNYGHTFGHAIEAVGRYGHITHGLAVALGMRVAARLAVLLNMIPPEVEETQNQLLDKFGLPKHFEIDKEKAWNLMALDKKVEAGKRVYILPRSIGKVEKKQEVKKELIFQAWEAIQQNPVLGGEN